MSAFEGCSEDDAGNQRKIERSLTSYHSNSRCRRWCYRHRHLADLSQQCPLTQRTWFVARPPGAAT